MKQQNADVQYGPLLTFVFKEVIQTTLGPKVSFFLGRQRTSELYRTWDIKTKGTVGDDFPL